MMFSENKMTDGKKTKITAKEAAQIATRYLAEMKNLRVYDISLEEIELTDDRNSWLVTLGHLRGYMGTAKDYKIIKVDAETGEVLSMKMRIVE